MLITFEGIDGSGKTTQSKRLFRFLKERGLPVHLFREPGGTPLAERLREILLVEEMDERTELLLFEASRAELCSKIILPLLESGEIVILDRFTDSTLAYQGYGRGIDLELVERLNEFSTFGLRPDLTFLLDLDPRTSLERVKERTRFESLEFLKKVREGFLEIARKEPDRVVILRTDIPEDQVFEEIVRILKERTSLI